MASIIRIGTGDSMFLLKLLRSCCNGTGLNVRHFHPSASKRVVALNMPSLSPTMASGTIVGWQKKEGDTISPGDVLCEIQTDKAVMAFETEEEGILAKILVNDNSGDIPVGSLIALLAEPGEDWQKVKSFPISQDTTTKKSSANHPDQHTGVNTSTHHSNDEGKSSTKRSLMGPAVRNLLEKYSLSAGTIDTTGPRGTLLKEDVIRYIEERKLTPKPLTQPQVASQQQTMDLKKPTTQKSKPKTVHNLLNEQEFQDIDLSNMRRVIAKRLTQSKTGIPHAYNTVICKIDSLLNFRKKFKAEGINFSINDIIVKAAATALSASPEVNVVWKGDKLVQPSSVDVSVAVATDSGLITPIVTDVLARGIPEIGNIVRQLAEKARSGKLQPHEFQGGSFTISNLGMYGIGEFSAIINPPQCAILAVGGSRLEIGDDGKPTTVFSATLSYDGEAISPTAAAAFMSILRSLLETPQNLLLGLQ